MARIRQEFRLCPVRFFGQILGGLILYHLAFQANLFGGAVATLGVAGAWEDENGHILRFPATAGSAPLEIGCQENLGNPNIVLSPNGDFDITFSVSSVITGLSPCLSAAVT